MKSKLVRIGLQNHLNLEALKLEFGVKSYNKAIAKLIAFYYENRSKK